MIVNFTCDPFEIDHKNKFKKTAETRQKDRISGRKIVMISEKRRYEVQ